MPNSLILPEGQEFTVLRKMLATNPCERIHAQEALNILGAQNTLYYNKPAQ